MHTGAQEYNTSAGIHYILDTILVLLASHNYLM